jgi:hypothetical protein
MGGGYQGALLARDVYEEKEDLEAQARKKDLWSGLGRTIGTLAALGITGGTAAPWVTAAWAGGLTAAGGAAGSAWAGDIEKGDFFKGERKELRKRLDPWGEENIVGGISAGVTAGIGQKIKMAKDVSTAQSLLGEGATVEELAKVGKEVESGYKGLDFPSSTLGKTEVGKKLTLAYERLVGGGRPVKSGGMLDPDVEQFYDPQAESLFKSKFTPGQRAETPLGRDIPLTIGQQSVEPASAGVLPFRTAEEGNAFRAWVNEYHSEIAREIDLDPTGSYNNRYITEAWAELGGAYKQR